MTVVAFGEILARLEAGANGGLQAGFGGAEANVAVALANWGIPVGYVTCLPDAHPIADAAVAELKGCGVDTSRVLRGPGRMGLYFHRATAEGPADFVYDREGSAMAVAEPAAFRWPDILNGARWLHVTGVTPALSASAAEAAREAMSEARRGGLTVSFDLNYRERLWRWGRPAAEVLAELTDLAGLLIANEGHLGMILEASDLAVEELAVRALARFPRLGAVAITSRGGAPDRATWSAAFHDRERFHRTAQSTLPTLAGRIGAGDAFAAGLVFGLLRSASPLEALGFAAAACRLKHSVPGDFLRCSVAEVAEVEDRM